MPKSTTKSDSITIPRWLYDQLVNDQKLVQHLAHYRGWGWIEAVKREMHVDEQYHLGAFRRPEDIQARRRHNKMREQFRRQRYERNLG